MTTAAAAAGVPRPALSVIKGSAAEAFANKRSIVSAMTWPFRWVARYVRKAAAWTRADRAAGWAYARTQSLVGVIGPKASVGWLLTSRIGQATIKFAAKAVWKIVTFSTRVVYGILTWPFRRFTATRRGIEVLDHSIARTIGKNGVLTAGVRSVGATVGLFVKHELPWMKAINTLFTFVIFVRLTRRFIPPGPWRTLTYAIEGTIFVVRFFLYTGATVLVLSGNADLTEEEEGGPRNFRQAVTNAVRSAWQRETEMTVNEATLATDVGVAADLKEAQRIHDEAIAVAREHESAAEMAQEAVEAARQVIDQLEEARTVAHQPTEPVKATTTTVVEPAVTPPAPGNGPPKPGPSMPTLVRPQQPQKSAHSGGGQHHGGGKGKNKGASK